MDVAEVRFVDEYLEESQQALRSFVEEANGREAVLAIAGLIADSLTAGHKLLLAGNGGSAGDSQHIAGEFVSRLFFDRAPLPAIALTTDTSVITAIGNDYGFEQVFERQVLGLGVPGDVFIGISTSGESPNVLRGLHAAKARKMVTVGFTGAKQCSMDSLCDRVLHVPSSRTAIIQQIHIVAAHMICGLVEARMFRDSSSHVRQ
ncbi:D-sedoheptulose 7-phosphate isomerase [Bradyrhizobium sp. USDA 4486]